MPDADGLPEDDEFGRITEVLALFIEALVTAEYPLEGAVLRLDLDPDVPLEFKFASPLIF